MIRTVKGNLVQQPTRKPTRKWVAMIIAGMVVGGVQTTLKIFWPGHPFEPLMDELGLYVQIFVVGAVGYITRNKQI
jgi:preprotein translocase subunit Sss1